MTFNATLETSQNIAKITLFGELDAATAPILKAKIEAAAAQNPHRLVLMMENLDYMASAGLRMLIFAKQKMGAQVDLFLVGVNDRIMDTIQKTGFHHSVVLVEDYETVSLER